MRLDGRASTSQSPLRVHSVVLFQASASLGKSSSALGARRSELDLADVHSVPLKRC